MWLPSFVREDRREHIALKQLFQQETQQWAESCNPEGSLWHEMHETSVKITGDGKSAFRFLEKV